jgi:hypothetical protein
MRLAFLPEMAKELVVLAADPGFLTDHFEGGAFEDTKINHYVPSF